MSKKKKSGRIVWAFDPFQSADKQIPGFHGYLQTMAKALGSQIEPVYVMSPDGLNWQGDLSGPWVKRYLPLAEDKAKSVLPADANFLSAKIIVNPKISLRGDVSRFLQYAKKQKAEMLVVATRARKGLSRWVLGSFSESLLLQSRIPVLTVNPEVQLPSQIHRVLFPTDLSNSSKTAYKKILHFCRRVGAELVIVHKLPDPIEPIVQSGVYMAGGGWISLNEFYEKANSERRKKLGEWQKFGEKAKVRVTTQIIDKPGLVPEAIVELSATPGFDLIALNSRASGASAFLLGSVARQVVRLANVPVLVWHSK